MVSKPQGSGGMLIPLGPTTDLYYDLAMTSHPLLPQARKSSDVSLGLVSNYYNAVTTACWFLKGNLPLPSLTVYPLTMAHLSNTASHL